MKRQLITGELKLVEPIHHYLTFLTIEDIENDTLTRVPVYMELNKDRRYLFEGRIIDVETITRGWPFFKKVDQEVRGVNFSYETKDFPEHDVKRINDDYGSQERHNRSQDIDYLAQNF